MKLRHEAMDNEEKAEPIDPNEKTEPIENAEFTEPILHTEFTDPMLRNELREPMLFAFWSERAGASGTLFSEDLEVVLGIINPAYRAALPSRTNHGARREQVVLCRKGRIFLPARAKNHLLAALRGEEHRQKALRGVLTGTMPGTELAPESFLFVFFLFRAASR